MSPAASRIKSPEDRAIVVPFILMLSIFIPALAVTAPVNVAAPPSAKLNSSVEPLVP